MYIKNCPTLKDIVIETWPRKTTDNLIGCIAVAWGAWLMEEPLRDDDGNEVDQLSDLVDFLDLCALPLRYTEQEITSLASKLLERGRIANARTLNKKYGLGDDSE